MTDEDKSKIGSVQGFVERTIESAKVISDPNISMGEKVMEYHNQGMNTRGAIFQMNQLKQKKTTFPSGGTVSRNSDVSIGGVSYKVTDCEFDTGVENFSPLRRDAIGNPTVTFKVENLDVDLFEKIRDAIETSQEQ